VRLTAVADPEREGWWRIEVLDRGPAVAPEVMEGWFAPHARERRRSRAVPAWACRSCARSPNGGAARRGAAAGTTGTPSASACRATARRAADGAVAAVVRGSCRRVLDGRRLAERGAEGARVEVAPDEAALHLAPGGAAVASRPSRACTQAAAATPQRWASRTIGGMARRVTAYPPRRPSIRKRPSGGRGGTDVDHLRRHQGVPEAGGTAAESPLEVLVVEAQAAVHAADPVEGGAPDHDQTAGEPRHADGGRRSMRRRRTPPAEARHVPTVGEALVLERPAASAPTARPTPRARRRTPRRGRRGCGPRRGRRRSSPRPEGRWSP
jgi:hypothetical protein